MKHGDKIPVDKLLDDNVVLHPVISSWREALTVDAKLLNSIKTDGQIEPVIFRQLGDKLQLIAGARRYFHQKMLGTKLEDIPQRVMELTDQQAMKVAAAENIFRKDWSKWEEARVISDLVTKGKMTMKDVASQMGLSLEVVKSRVALAELPEEIFNVLKKKDLPIGYADTIKALDKYPEAQVELINEIIKGTERGYTGIHTIEEANEFISKVEKKVKDQEELLKQYGPCPKCNSTNIHKSGYHSEAEKLMCNDCEHSWHGETKEAWEYYETKQKMKEMGIEVTEGPDKVTLTPRDVAKIVKEEAKAKADRLIEREEKEGTKLPKNFRSKAPLEAILAPLIHENLQKIEVRGDTITIELIEHTKMSFKGLKKDYTSGTEFARIETSYSYDDEDLQRIHDFINAVTKKEK